MMPRAKSIQYRWTGRLALGLIVCALFAIGVRSAVVLLAAEPAVETATKPADTAHATKEPATAKKAESTIDFGRDIQPILARKCFSCHGPDTAEGGLRLHTEKGAFAALESGEHAIVAGKLKQSELFRRIAAKDESERMPPEGKPLTAEQIALFQRWIESGAKWDQHWSFKPVAKVTPPQVASDGSTNWVRTPIDAFILAKLQAASLSPAPAADKIALLRRAYYDLIGLPPTPAEVDAFLADTSDSAFEKVVDRLLNSPQYGERWGRHWLDLVRYADTNSFERDGAKPNAWRYRDYVIRSLNEDKPYDQFIREQLAGDELENVTSDSLIATGIYRLGMWDDEPADPVQARYDGLDDLVATTSQAFLGLTVNCARCHDHKIDPIPQTDYYKLLAIFHDIKPYGDKKGQHNQTDISPIELRDRYAKMAEERQALSKKRRGIEQSGIIKMPGADQRDTETDKRDGVIKEKLQKYLTEEEWASYQEVKKQQEELKKVESELPPRLSALTVEVDTAPPATFILQRGNPHVPGDAVEPGFPELFGSVAFKAVPPTSGKSSGRRLALANWIASPDNMLTARVMVNRIWQHHFGRGLVRTPNNFGQLGEAPTHPDLLDWLANEFMRTGWRLKPMHKLIMLSSSYQMSSQSNAAAMRVDPGNNLFWRFDMRRLSAEELRDASYAVTGKLNSKMFGPGFYADISDEVKAGQSQPGAGWGSSSPEQKARRAIYIHVKRSLITPLLSSFDFPENDSSCEARFVTTQPGQALAMLNGQFAHEQADALSKRLKSEAGDKPAEQIQLAHRLTVSRAATANEVARGEAFLKKMQEKHSLSPEQALKMYCLLILNLNEFVYLD